MDDGTGVERIAAVLRGLGIVHAEISTEGDALRVAFPTTGRDSIRALCDLTRDLAVAMTWAGVEYRSIRVTGIGATMTVAA